MLFLSSFFYRHFYSISAKLDDFKTSRYAAGSQPPWSQQCKQNIFLLTFKYCLMNKKTILRISDIASTPAKTGILPVSPATIWRWVSKGAFPAPFKLSAGVTGWYASDIESFIAECAAEAA